MRKLINSQRGSSLIGALMTLMVLGFTGMAVVEMGTGENMASVNEMQTSQATYVGHAGIEYAKDRLSLGLSPDVANKNFGMGDFTVVSSPDQSSFQVESQVGNARKIQTIGADFSANCAALDLTEAYIQGDNLVNARLIKYCNEAMVITDMVIDWEFGACQSDADVDSACVKGTYGDYSSMAANAPAEETPADNGNVQNGNPALGLYAQYEDPDHAGKVLICHVPSGDMSKAHTLSVSVSGWENGHKKGQGDKHNKDSLGPCGAYENNSGDDENPPVDDDEDVDENACNYYEKFIYQCANDAPEFRDHGGAHVIAIGLEGNLIYDAASNMGTPVLPGANGAETIDTVDTTIASDGTYTFKGPGESPTTHIQFDTQLQEGRWYQVTVMFADGSQLTQSFIATSSSDVEDDDETPPNDDPGFEVEDGEIISEPEQGIDIEVIGSAITYGAGGPEINVTVELGTVAANGQVAWTDLYANQDVDGGENYATVSGTTGKTYIIRATAEHSTVKNKKKTILYKATYDSRNTTQVKTLVNGQQAPALAGFGGQKPITAFLAPYLDAQGKVTLAYNQAIMLFELGVDVSQDPSSTAADFQDLVILFTFEAGDVQYKKVGDQLHYLEKK